jgi:hypothetical protein
VPGNSISDELASFKGREKDNGVTVEKDVVFGPMAAVYEDNLF